MRRARPVVALILGLGAIAGGAAGTTGCGSRCVEVAAARDALLQRQGAAHRIADVRVTLPLTRVNQLLAEILHDHPVSVPIPLPRLAGIPPVPGLALTAVARAVSIHPGPSGKLRVAATLELREGDTAITSFELLAEVTPVLEHGAASRQPRADGGSRGARSGAGTSSSDDASSSAGTSGSAGIVATELVIPLGLEQLISLEAAPAAQAALTRAVLRWLPASLRSRLPFLDEAARAYGGELYRLLRRTLLPRLEEATRLRLRLPELPIAEARVTSSASPHEMMVVELVTSLPVRRGLPPLPAPAPRSGGDARASGDSRDSGDEVTVQLAPSATAELSNWAIDRGLLPRWYSRSMSPSVDGEYRPRFDHDERDAGHPFKIYAFQERGGCSYFRVGVRAELAMSETGALPEPVSTDAAHRVPGETAGPAQLKLTVLDRTLEAASASPLIEAAAWVKYFLWGSVDLSRRLAAHTRLDVGARTFEARVIGAAMEPDQLRFELRFAVVPPDTTAR